MDPLIRALQEQTLKDALKNVKVAVKWIAGRKVLFEKKGLRMEIDPSREGVLRLRRNPKKPMFQENEYNGKTLKCLVTVHYRGVQVVRSDVYYKTFTDAIHKIPDYSISFFQDTPKEEK